MENIYWQKRLSLLLGFFLLISAVLFFRLFQKQILEHSNYSAQAEDQYIIKKNLPAERGKIYSSDLYPLAANKQFFQVLAVPKNVKDPDKTAKSLASILEIKQSDLFELINNDKPYIPPLKHGLTEEQGDRIANLKLKGVIVLPESRRFYPEGSMASNILGFVNDSNQGQYGLEGYYNDELSGTGGQIYAEKDVLGRYFNIGEKVDPKDGSDYVLTIDRNIQFKAEHIIKNAVKKYQADSGSIIIIEPKTSAVLSMATSPTYDPNEFNKVSKEDQDIFNNSIISKPWEPGSVFKPLIMAAAINEGLIQPDTKETFANKVTVDSYEIHTSTDEAYGEETMTQVLENSDNVAMVWISEKLGKDPEYKYLKDFGFGRKLGIELDTENPGDVLDVKKWSNTQRATISFGQGIATTPLQLVNAIGVIANGGILMKPYIVSEVQDSDGKKDASSPQEVKRVLNTDVAAKVKDMLVSVVVNGHGKKAGVEGYKVAGKTGTAQVPAPGGGYYKDRHIGSFVGFAPADDPKFVMLVKLDQPKNVDWAESSAAPTFGEMASWLLDYFRVPPTK